MKYQGLNLMNGILQQNRSKSELNARDVVGIGFKRSMLTLQLAERLKMIADASGDEKAIYNAAKLAKCGELSNIYNGEFMHNSDGEVFNGVGHLYSCRLAMCQNCVALKARLRRRSVRDTLKRLKPLVGTNWNFVTLTAPTVAAPLLDSIEVYLRAWELFRKRKWFVETVDAGWRGLEFTCNKETGLAHVHIHAVTLSKFPYPSDVRREWQDCITKAWRDDWKGRKAKRVSLVFPASGAVIDIVEINQLDRRDRPAIESAILELCKYFSKADDWLALSDADLLAVSQLPRLDRLFASFGKAHRKSKSNADTLNRLDTHNIKDGKRLKPLKTKRIAFPKRGLIHTLNARVNVTRTFRKARLISRYPCADFTTLDGRDFIPSEPKFTGTLTLVKKPKE
jgi:hypothetical protein